MKKRVTLLIILLLISACDTSTSRSVSENVAERGIAAQIVDDAPTNPKPLNQEQLALVIGNNQYKYRPLANPVNDAIEVAQVLDQMDFEVTLETDLNQVAMGQAIRDFGIKLSNTPGIGLFYFAGHGVQVDGQNYLLPIDNNKIIDKYSLKAYAIDLETLLARMGDARNRLNIIILDACRDDPFRGAGRSLGRGLARIQSISGSIIAFATAPGKTASDISIGENHGLFTKYLLNGLKRAHQKHQRIDDMFMQIRNGVLQESGGDQEPWYSASLNAPFCFGGCRQTMENVVVAPQEPSPQVSVPPVTTPEPSSPQPPFSLPVEPSTKPGSLFISLSLKRYIDNGDGTILDKKTGLIWLKQANCFGQKSWKAAKKVVAQLADGQCGLSDSSLPGWWRLPTIDEFQAIVDKKYQSPPLSNALGTNQWKEGDAFSDVQAFHYWSATPNAHTQNDAMIMGFLWHGMVISGYKGNEYHVWAVRDAN